eukprot:CAMPEP_0113883678 /NCGR_PEP_ID=MMETSP0780_2-20120614/9756_1 /TAXON_ID=652834 /ORGANISM="Palpitomonas bilix" /LENGTH=979 /DNA_ID=CAMNT_0000871055 /DNA_START=190 /DNA_END=3129 /DNA_ORIENTATION=- /assembly_acc=CAM_ASM_000599
MERKNGFSCHQRVQPSLEDLRTQLLRLVERGGQRHWRNKVICALTAKTQTERKEKVAALSQKLDQSPNQALSAFKEGDGDAITALLTMSGLKTERDSEGKTVLHYLAGNLLQDDILDRALRALVKEDRVDANGVDEEGFSPLHIAAMYGNARATAVLLELGCDIHMETKEGCTALWFACFTNNVKCAEVLLSKGAEIEGFREEPCLFVAACVGSVELCKLLVSHGAKVGCREAIQMTPLMGACENGHVDVASYLLSQGACATDRDERGRSALWKACHGCHAPCVRLLLSNGVRARELLLDSAVRAAETSGEAVASAISGPCTAGCVEVVQLLLDGGASPEGAHELETPLLLASGHGHVNVCKVLLDAAADVNRVAVGKLKGATAVLAAIEGCHLDVAALLMERGANLNTEGDFGNCLSKAVLTGKQNVVQYVLGRGGTCMSGKHHPLFICATKGDVEMARFLMKHGIRVQDVKGPLQPLIAACAASNSELVDLFLECGADPNGDCLGGQNALFQAASAGDMVLMTKLLEHGANVDGHKGAGHPLAMAAQEGKLEAAKFLVSKGAKINVPAQPILLAIDSNHIDLALYLIEAGGDPDYPHPQGQNALWKAAFGGHVRVVEALLSKGAHADGQKKEGSAPIIVAAQNGHTDVLKRLVDAGANIDAHSEQVSALLAAVNNDRYECVKFLLENGAKMDSTRNGTLLTPLDFAFMLDKVSEEIVVLLVRAKAPRMGNFPLMCQAAKKSARTVELLRQEGVDLHVVDRDGDTPLHFAATSKENGDVIRYLAEQGCDLEAKNHAGMTPLYVAVTRENVEIVSTLLEVGADPSSLQQCIQSYSPAEICSRDARLCALLTKAISPEGSAHRAAILSQRRTRKRTAGQVASSSETSSAFVQQSNDNTSAVLQWSNFDVVSWARTIRLHADAVSILEENSDFDGPFLTEATLDDLTDVLQMPPISAHRLLRARNRLLSHAPLEEKKAGSR